MCRCKVAAHPLECTCDCLTETQAFPSRLDYDISHTQVLTKARQVMNVKGRLSCQSQSRLGYTHSRLAPVKKCFSDACPRDIYHLYYLPSTDPHNTDTISDSHYRLITFLPTTHITIFPTIDLALPYSPLIIPTDSYQDPRYPPKSSEEWTAHLQSQGRGGVAGIWLLR